MHLVSGGDDEATDSPAPARRIRTRLPARGAARVVTAPEPKDRPDSGLAVRVVDVGKAFGPTQAIRRASVEVRVGEVHCVVGENGSGKSTLVKILAGVHAADSGYFEVAGIGRARLRSPKAALRVGIATVFQEVLVIESRSVLENVWLGFDGVFASTLTMTEKRQQASAVLERLLGRNLRLGCPVEELSLSERQACAITRALLRRPRILILDEATSALDVRTRDRLFALVRELAGAGTATIFISHRMDEIAEMGDRCTVMRAGETVATLGRDEASVGELVRLMTGADHLAPAEARRPVAARGCGPVVLRTERLCLRPGAAEINFTVRAGELVGLAGLEGQGQDAFIKALWGIGAKGTVFAGQEAVASPRHAASVGISYVPRERRAEAIFESRSIRENFALPTLQRDRRAGLLSPTASRRRLTSWTERLGIRIDSAEAWITTLSGGNQQKIVMARWLATEPRVLLLNDPTRGVDIAAKRDLYRMLGEVSQRGAAVVILSTELDEHVELVDRVLVFREQAVFCELTRGQLNRDSLVAAYFGGRDMRITDRESVNA